MRTTPEQVRAIITTSVAVSVDPFIVVANALTNYCVSKDSGSKLSSALQIQLETYLAAYFYALRDQQYASKSTGGASAQWQVGQPGPGAFQANDWGRTAMMLDVTGTLTALNQGIVRQWMIHLGDAACVDPWASVCDACSSVFA